MKKKISDIDRQTLKIIITVFITTGICLGLFFLKEQRMPHQHSETLKVLSPQVSSNSNTEPRVLQKSPTSAHSPIKSTQTFVNQSWQSLLNSPKSELKKTWPELLSSLSKKKGYFGLLGSHINNLEQKAHLKGFNLDKTENLPTLVGQGGRCILQIIDGHILGADLIFETEASSASWGMYTDFLAQGADWGQRGDPMLFLEDIAMKGETLDEQQISGRWEIQEGLYLNYQLSLSKEFSPIKARLWVSP